MDLLGGCAKTSTLRDSDKCLKLLKVKIDACHALIVSKVAIYGNITLLDDTA
jgi:hypothetical protein